MDYRLSGAGGIGGLDVVGWVFTVADVMGNQHGASMNVVVNAPITVYFVEHLNIVAVRRSVETLLFSPLLSEPN